MRNNKIVSNMNRTYKQQYNQEQNLEIKVASNWGYSVCSNNLESKSKKQVQSQAPKLANITLRQFIKDIPKTDRIKQVQDEIKALHNQRKLMEENQRAAEAVLNGLAPQNNKNKIMEWVEQRIRQYNAIVEHRHLMKNDDQKGQLLQQSQTQQETSLSQKEPLNDMESRIAEWAQRKFAEYINSKDPALANKKQPPQSKKAQQKQLLREDILKKIESKKKQLLNAPSADLTHQISINREIASLYRLFYRKHQLNSGDQFRKTRSIAAEPPRSLDKHRSDIHIQETNNRSYRVRFLSTNMKNSASDNSIIEDAKNVRKNSTRDVRQDLQNTQIVKKYKQTEYKKFYTTNRKLSKDSFKQDSTLQKSVEKRKLEKPAVLKELNEPYLQKKELQAYKYMQSKIRSNGEAFQIWKSKIQDVCSKSTVLKGFEQSSKTKLIEQNKAKNQQQQRQQELETIIGNSLKELGDDEGANTSKYLKEIASKSKQHEQQKEDIFAELLRKRNNKFNKLWGTKILVKYDSRGQAKQMLQGGAEKRAIVGDQVGWNNSKSRSVNYSDSTPVDLIGGSQEVGLIKQENDEQHYWRMCKNQKINLLLKRR